jgi:calpain-7
MKNLKQWQRAHEIVTKDQLVNGIPDVATQINGYEITQRQVGDCSVLSSLAVAAHLEFKSGYKKKLISWLIYPQDTLGNPMYNPTGQYVVKLFVNGAWRAVPIDDYIPVSKQGNPIGAYSSRGKLWV